MKHNNGFTLIELLISMSLMVVIVAAILSVLIATQTTTLTEARKLDMNQGARALEVLLYEHMRSAGSVLSLLHTPGLLGRTAAFTGIYPLNNADFPDGIILASGDIAAITKVREDFTPGDSSLKVDTTDNADGQPAWEAEDVGLLVKEDAYYVFKVLATPAAGANELSVRPTAVYYSGLLNTANYDDPCDDVNGGLKGNADFYRAGLPAIRLNYFQIYLVEEKTDNLGTPVRTLTLTTDTEEEADVIGAAPTNSRNVMLVPNIEDIQFEYMTAENPPQLWASMSGEGLTTYSDPCNSGQCVDFINVFRSRNLRSIRTYVLFKTEEEKNKQRNSGLEFSRPIMGDIAAATIPIARYHYNYMNYEVWLRNCSIPF
jgi:prepilin-type N-terminal cleavage/methylation domain-containing protein